MNTDKKKELTRREFVRNTTVWTVGTALGLGVAGLSSAAEAADKKPTLKVWACGGLAEGLTELNALFERKYTCSILLTSAPGGRLARVLARRKGGQVDVFISRTLKINAPYLVKHGKMKQDFNFFCMQEYVVVTPLSNPAKVEGIADLGRKNLKVAFSPKAPTAASKCILEILDAAGVKDQFLRNVAVKKDCPREFLKHIVKGKVHAAVVERRLTTLPLMKGKVQVIPISPEFMCAGEMCRDKPLFTIGLMTGSVEPELAKTYIDFALSGKGREVMVKHGFVHATSDKMKSYRELLDLDEGLFVKKKDTDEKTNQPD
jgi:molybdate transport system substrate-binding protein